MDLIGKKRTAHLAHLHDPQCTTKKDILRIICSTVQFKLCEMQDSWLSARANDIEGYADKNDIKNFYSCLKEVYGPTSITSTTISNIDSYRKVNAASVRNVWLLTWCLLQENCQEQITNLYSTYVDLTKAFDMVSRDSISKIMTKYSWPQNSSPSLDDFMRACMQRCKTTEKGP